jgi:putative sterol carrier protein
MSETVKDIVEKISKKLTANPGISQGINTVCQFVINGDGGGNWCFDLTRNPPETFDGTNEKAVCTITMDAPDFIAMINKGANPVQLFMSGKLKIDGDISTAMKLQGIF